MEQSVKALQNQNNKFKPFDVLILNIARAGFFAAFRTIRGWFGGLKDHTHAHLSIRDFSVSVTQFQNGKSNTVDFAVLVEKQVFRAHEGAQSRKARREIYILSWTEARSPWQREINILFGDRILDCKFSSLNLPCAGSDIFKIRSEYRNECLHVVA